MQTDFHLSLWTNDSGHLSAQPICTTWNILCRQKKKQTEAWEMTISFSAQIRKSENGCRLNNRNCLQCHQASMLPQIRLRLRLLLPTFHFSMGTHCFRFYSLHCNRTFAKSKSRQVFFLRHKFQSVSSIQFSIYIFILNILVCLVVFRMGKRKKKQRHNLC